jgi:hypothetical protein
MADLDQEERINKLEQKVQDLINEKNKHIKLIDDIHKDLKVDTITAKTIKVKNDDHPHDIIMTVTSTVAGLWLRGQEGNGMVAIYNDVSNGPVVGIYGPVADKALDISLSVKDSPVIQVYDRKHDQIYLVSPKHLGSLVKPEKL